MSGQHNYKLTVKWTGNTGTGTSNYRAFERSHTIIVENIDVRYHYVIFAIPNS